MKALILPNMSKARCGEITQTVIDILCQDNIEVCALTECNDMIPDDRIEFISLEHLKGNVDFAITIGGDGTIIKAANILLETEIPLIGVNLGTLGFLAGVEVDELELLHKLKINDFNIEERLTLKVEIQNDSEKKEFTAINDVIICKNAFSGILDIDVSCGGIETARYRADGVIFSTASGSTGYAMSAGGPIIHPTVKAISLTPICAHSLLSRPIILPEFERVLVKTNADLDKRSACVVADGQNSCEVTQNDSITISRYCKNIRFICLNGKNYYSAINDKLMER